MHSKPSLDHGKPYDWGKTSSDYSAHRPGYPGSFFRALEAIGIGRPDQRILDLASGPGVLAVPFALLFPARRSFREHSKLADSRFRGLTGSFPPSST